MRVISSLITPTILILAISYTPATAGWSDEFGLTGPAAPVNGAVRDFLVEGNDLYMVGDFTNIGGVPAKQVAHWDGSAWSAVGNPVFTNSVYNVHVNVVTRHQGLLVVAGAFNGINGQPGDVAVWNGATWAPLGNDPLYGATHHRIDGLVSDGVGLFIGGTFDDLVVEFDGTNTIPLVSTATGPCCVYPFVQTATLWNGDLIVGGGFNDIDGIAMNDVARWDGSQWHALGSGLPTHSQEVFVHDGDLYAMTRRDVYHFDGSAWVSVTGQEAGCDFINYPSMDALFFQGDLYRTDAGRNFATAKDLFGVAKWSGAAWDDMLGGLGDGCGSLYDPIGGPMTEYDGRLVVGGTFSSAGGMTAQNLAAWTGDAWYTNSPAGRVRAIATRGSDVFVGGDFTKVRDLPAIHVARWDGAAWHQLQSGVNGIVHDMVVIGNDLYVCGEFTSASGTPVKQLARWDGTSWSAVSADFDPGSGAVYALETDGTNLYVGGEFLAIAQSQVLRNVAMWDGTNWHALGNGITNGTVRALALDGGDLYVGGDFTQADFALTGNTVRWDGSTWSSLDLGMNDRVDALAVQNGQLYAGGIFTAATGGATVNHIARWNGTSWEPVESTVPHGFDQTVNDLAASPVGLIAVGAFTTAGGAPASHIVRWDGAAWQTYGTGINKAVDAVAVANSNIWVGGEFERAGDENSLNFAKWAGVPSGIGGTTPVATATLDAPYPNPFNPTTQIRYHLDRPAAVSVAIFDVSGRRVRTLVEGASAPVGTRTIVWDGTGDDGRPAASGVYYVRMQAGNQVFTRKAVLLK